MVCSLGAVAGGGHQDCDGVVEKEVGCKCAHTGVQEDSCTSRNERGGGSRCVF